MLNITMDCRKLTTSRAARAYLAEKMTDLPLCSDGTLLGLYDALIDPMQATSISFVNPPVRPAQENDYLERLLCVFLDASRTNPDLKVDIIHEN